MVWFTCLSILHLYSFVVWIRNGKVSRLIPELDVFVFIYFCDWMWQSNGCLFDSQVERFCIWILLIFYEVLLVGFLSSSFLHLDVFAVGYDVIKRFLVSFLRETFLLLNFNSMLWLTKGCWFNSLGSHFAFAHFCSLILEFERLLVWFRRMSFLLLYIFVFWFESQRLLIWFLKLDVFQFGHFCSWIW